MGIEKVPDGPLKWWAVRVVMAPRLSHMARDYLSIPGESRVYLNSSLCELELELLNHLSLSLATTTDVERLFSQGRILLDHTRNRMKDDTTRAILCLKSWFEFGQPLVSTAILVDALGARKLLPDELVAD
jgi:hypothetical protein